MRHRVVVLGGTRGVQGLGGETGRLARVVGAPFDPGERGQGLGDAGWRPLVASRRQRQLKDSSRAFEVKPGGQASAEVGQQHVRESGQPEISRQSQGRLDGGDAGVMVAAQLRRAARCIGRRTSSGRRHRWHRSSGMLARNAFSGVAVAIFDERASSGHERDHRRDPGLRARDRRGSVLRRRAARSPERGSRGSST